MRPVLFAAFLSASPLCAEQFNVDMIAEHALISPRASVITYKAPISLPAGRHQLTFQIPQSDVFIRDAALPEVFAAEFTGDDAPRMLGSQSRRAPATRLNSPALTAARTAVFAAQDRLAELDRDIAKSEADLLAAEQRVVFLESIAEGPKFADLATPHIDAAEAWRPMRAVAARLLWHDYLGGAR